MRVEAVVEGEPAGLEAEVRVAVVAAAEPGERDAERAEALHLRLHERRHAAPAEPLLRGRDLADAGDRDVAPRHAKRHRVGADARDDVPGVVAHDGVVAHRLVGRAEDVREELLEPAVVRVLAAEHGREEVEQLLAVGGGGEGDVHGRGRLKGKVEG